MGGYNFEGKRGRKAPRKKEYEFYIAAKDNSGNYSDHQKVTVQHPGIQQLEQPTVSTYFQAFEIIFPEVLTKSSTQTVYPENDKVEDKEILGYILKMERLDKDDSMEKRYPIDDVKNNSVVIEIPENSEWEIQVGAYDSVYHPDYNEDLFNSTLSETLTVKEPGLPEDLITPSSLTESLQEEIDHSYVLEDILENTEPNSDDQFYAIRENYNEISSVIGELDKDADEVEYTSIQQNKDQISLNASDITTNEDEIKGVSTEVDIMADGFMVRTQQYGDEDVVSGFGLAIDEDDESEFQILADRFQIFNPEVEEGTPIFGIDTDEEIIYMDANEIQIRGGETEDNVVIIDDLGLEVDMPKFKLNRSDGSAEFGGELNAIEGTFTNKLSASNENIILTEGDNGGRIEINDAAGTKVASLSSSEESTGSNKSGTMILFDEDGNNRVGGGVNTDNNSGQLFMYDGDDMRTISLEATSAGVDSARFSLREPSGDISYDTIFQVDKERTAIINDEGVSIGFNDTPSATLHIKDSANLLHLENDDFDSKYVQKFKTLGEDYWGFGMESANLYLEEIDDGSHHFNMKMEKILMSNLPTSDPNNAKQLWNDGGTLKVSSG